MKPLIVFFSLLLSSVLSASAANADYPQFNLGFKALADQIPDIVGVPVEDEHYGANGDSLQQTSTGLMAWRKADNWTAFTNGSRTWVNGPSGVQSRTNSVRFDWEASATPTTETQSEAPPPAPAPLPPTPPQPPPPAASPPQSDETAAAEFAALDMINRSRQDNGVAPLAMDEAIRQVARAGARDMSVRNFFAHVNPDGLQPWDRMRAAGISFSTAAENIAWSMGYASAIDGVRTNHQTMMAETPPNDGHRVNVLNSNLKRIGIGVYRGDDGKIFYVTDFVG